MAHRIDRLLLGLCAAVCFLPGTIAQTSVPGTPAASSIGPEQPEVERPARVRVVRVRMRDGLRFDPARLTANPGEDLVLELENADTTEMPHNFLLLKPGTREEVVRRAAALGEHGPERDFVPPGDDVVAASAVLPVDGMTRLRVRLPDEPGIYPYVCTFPGHGIMMYGALYVGVRAPSAGDDPHIPSSSLQNVIPGAGQRPYVQRVFLPESGPAAIAVALSRNQNICWDAGTCRLRYAWQGDFIDAYDHWKGKGGSLAKVPEQLWWRADVPVSPLRLGGKEAPVKFLGYRVNKDGAEFHYRLGSTEVFEQVVPAESGSGLEIRYRIPDATIPISYVAPSDDSQWTSTAGTWTGRTLQLTANEAKAFSVSFTTPLCRP